MIYDALNLDDDIRQGDIFINLPFVDLDLERLYLMKEDDRVEELSWNNLLSNDDYDDSKVIVNLQKINGIVISQDCDCERNRNEYISLAVISKWDRNYQSLKRWMTEIISLNRGVSKMYLPPDSDFNLDERFHIEFSRIFKIPSDNLYVFRNLRVARLNTESLEHFQNKIGHYFKRYAHDEHYPLNKEEMDEYEEWREKEYERREYQR